MSETAIRVPIDEETLKHLRELATKERRATAEQAAVILERAVSRRTKREADDRSG
jgi:hypothetical protein